jgi:hypothetical protein
MIGARVDAALAPFRSAFRAASGVRYPRSCGLLPSQKPRRCGRVVTLAVACTTDYSLQSRGALLYGQISPLDDPRH